MKFRRPKRTNNVEWKLSESKDEEEGANYIFELQTASHSYSRLEFLGEYIEWIETSLSNFRFSFVAG